MLLLTKPLSWNEHSSWTRGWSIHSGLLGIDFHFLKQITFTYNYFHFLIGIDCSMSWLQLNEGAEYAERIVDEYTLHEVFMFSQEYFPLLVPLVFTCKKPVFYFLPAFCSVLACRGCGGSAWSTLADFYNQVHEDSLVLIKIIWYVIHVLLFS